MKVACLISAGIAPIWLVNHLYDEHEIGLVVIEKSPTRPRPSLLVRLFFLIQGLCGRFGRGFSPRQYPPSRQRQMADADAILGDNYQSLRPGLIIFEASDINGQAVVDRLRDFSPDVIIDHGTAILCPEVLTTAPLALNVHWGLSPYYRGSGCTAWALIEHDPYNIGVTVHKLSSRIDGGDILGQIRVVPQPQDSCHTINLKLTREAAGLILMALGHLKNGADLPFVPQDLTRGRVYRGRMWSRHLTELLNDMESRDGIAGMLRQPSRRELLPIVEFPGIPPGAGTA